MSISLLLSPFNPSHLTKKVHFHVKSIAHLIPHDSSYNVSRKWGSSNKVIIQTTLFSVPLKRKRVYYYQLFVHSYPTTFVAHSSIYTEKNINFVFVFLLNFTLWQLLDICFPIVFCVCVFSSFFLMLLLYY